MSDSRLNRSDWFDLPVRDLADAMSFYEGLLGWHYRRMDDSPLTHYVMIETDGQLIGGLRQVPKESPNPSDHTGPILYFNVHDLAAKVIRAKELGAVLVGGEVHLGKERGRYQCLRDREGHVIGLWSAS